jgi:hypothetical protein
MAKYRVNGYLFETEEEARQAKKEADGIRYIREQMGRNDPDVLLRLYERLIEKNTFETVVGIAFLRELQVYLESVPSIRKEDIPPIPVPDRALDKERENRRSKHETLEHQIMERNSGRERHYRRLSHGLAVVCALLAVTIVGMFVITYASGNSMNIYNYEQQVIDKYEAWEQELDEREADLTKREQILQNQTGQ